MGDEVHKVGWLERLKQSPPVVIGELILLVVGLWALRKTSLAQATVKWAQWLWTNHLLQIAAVSIVAALVLAVACVVLSVLLIRSMRAVTRLKAMSDFAQSDDALFQEFWKTLPRYPTTDFLKDNNFAGFAYDTERVRPLFRFEHEWHDPAHKFLTPELEVCRADLMKAAVKFIRLEAHETFPTGTGFQSVPPEWEIEQPERFARVVRELGEYADEIVAAHDALVSAALTMLPSARAVVLNDAQE